MFSLPNGVFLLSSVVSLPVYLLLINRVLHQCTGTFSSTVYSVLLSRAIVDVSAGILHILTASIREFSWFKSFFWDSAHTYLPTICYAQIYYFIFARLIAILLAAVERLLTLRFPSGLILISSGPSCLSSVFIWIIPLFLAWPMLIQLDCSFASEDSLKIVVPENESQIHYLELVITAGITIIVVCSIFVYLFVYRERFRTQENPATIRTLFQVAPILLLLFCLLFELKENVAPPRMFEPDSTFSYIQALLTYSTLWISLLDEKIRQNLFSNKRDF